MKALGLSLLNMRGMVWLSDAPDDDYAKAISAKGVVTVSCATRQKACLSRLRCKLGRAGLSEPVDGAGKKVVSGHLAGAPGWRLVGIWARAGRRRQAAGRAGAGKRRYSRGGYYQGGICTVKFAQQRARGPAHFHQKIQKGCFFTGPVRGSGSRTAIRPNHGGEHRSVMGKNRARYRPDQTVRRTQVQGDFLTG